METVLLRMRTATLRHTRSISLCSPSMTERRHLQLVCCSLHFFLKPWRIKAMFLQNSCWSVPTRLRRNYKRRNARHFCFQKYFFSWLTFNVFLSHFTQWKCRSFYFHFPVVSAHIETSDDSNCQNVQDCCFRNLRTEQTGQTFTPVDNECTKIKACYW